MWYNYIRNKKIEISSVPLGTEEEATMFDLLKKMEEMKNCNEEGHNMRPYRNLTDEERVKFAPFKCVCKCSKCGHLQYKKGEIL